jgi:hypothetical protein
MKHPCKTMCGKTTISRVGGLGGGAPARGWGARLGVDRSARSLATGLLRQDITGFLAYPWTQVAVRFVAKMGNYMLSHRLYFTWLVYRQSEKEPPSFTPFTPSSPSSLRVLYTRIICQWTWILPFPSPSFFLPIFIRKDVLVLIGEISRTRGFARVAFLIQKG